jgi:hypothetical protein
MPIMNLIKTILFALLTLSCTQDYGKLNLVIELPKILNEVSGITQNNNTLLMINDSNNPAVVYQYNISEKIIDTTYTIAKAKNKDWEDLTRDQKGNLYIGDFGNNLNKRKNLVIYKTNLNAPQKTEIISFTLEDQKEFPPKKKNLNFDIEAFFYSNGNLYLFTRNRSSHFDGTTKMYKIPSESGIYIAKQIGTFKSCNDRKDCQITSAAIHEASNTVALLSYNKVWLISNYKKDHFLEGTIKEIKLGHSSQKEGITFKDANTLYITDERKGSTGRNLYTLEISKIK